MNLAQHVGDEEWSEFNFNIRVSRTAIMTKNIIETSTYSIPGKAATCQAWNMLEKTALMHDIDLKNPRELDSICNFHDVIPVEAGIQS
tara:strand:- start:5035 stop:5298 length:264 start_codon:yes stop_codon:yes gene_type:complete